jgi:hypothetical protein
MDLSSHTAKDSAALGSHSGQALISSISCDRKDFRLHRRHNTAPDGSKALMILGVADGLA